MKTWIIILIVVIILCVLIIVGIVAYYYLRHSNLNSNIKSAELCSSSLSSVSNVNLKYGLGNSLFLSWTGIDGSNISYNIYYSNSSSFVENSGTFLTNVTSTSTTIKNLPPATYYFKVSAVQETNSKYCRSAGVPSSPTSLTLPNLIKNGKYILKSYGEWQGSEYYAYMETTQNPCGNGLDKKTFFNIQFTDKETNAVNLSINDYTNTKIYVSSSLNSSQELCLFSPYTNSTNTRSQYTKDAISLCYGPCNNPELTSANSVFTFTDQPNFPNILTLNTGTQVVQGQVSHFSGNVDGPYVNPTCCTLGDRTQCGSGDTKLNSWSIIPQN